MKVLYVEDDPAARMYVDAGLARKGVAVDTASGAEAGFQRARASDYDVLIIDVTLPDGDGFELLRRLRADGVETPAVFLTAHGKVSDRLRGFGTGADDYLAKPFAMAELVARIRAIARRTQRATAEVVRVADLEVDVTARKVSRAGRVIELPPTQYAFLEILALRKGRVVTRHAIIAHAWAHEPAPSANAVNVQASLLRRRVDEGFATRLIHTVPRVGYVLEERASPRTRSTERDGRGAH
jgi:two-component system copper resistance phosphate regulon response regulator CusR